MFNQLFATYNMNCIYLPREFFYVSEILPSMKAFNVLGFGVSAPFKQQIIPLLDQLDSSAGGGSINTVVLKDGKSKGYSTDGFGFFESIKNHQFGGIVIYGNGGVVRSITHICDLNQVGYQVYSRGSQPLEKLPESFMLVNATPSEFPDDPNFSWLLRKSETYYDLKVQPKLSATQLSYLDSGRKCFWGWEMSTFQLIRQFEIYFGKRLDPSEVFSIVEKEYLDRDFKKGTRRPN
ncbi:MAG: hypothetical protein LW875_05280 [Proteobacteria bacterium]|nr:hypothetical protein [Pseudomonadota bacterium]